MNIKKDLRPLIHFTARKNWINDPNGFSYYNDVYHLFFQYNPKGIVWGNMSWGHAISDDLIHWKELDVVMVPDKPYDKDGVFSGSAIDRDGTHSLYYTGVEFLPEGVRQVQCMAKSDDGITYQKDAANPILIADEHGDEYDFRDPKVWLYDNRVYMVVASKKDGAGKALVYQSADGYTFDYLTEFNKENTGFMWECPDLFQVQNQWALMFSSMEVEGYTAENVSFIAPVDFDYGASKTKVHEYELMDYGADYYAPQSMVDNKGRRIVIAWLRMEVPLNEETDWVGMMTLPREVRYGEDGFYYKVIDEVFAGKRSISKDQEYLLEKNGNVSATGDTTQSFRLKKNKVYELKTDLSSKSSIHLCNEEYCGLSISYSSITGQVKVIRCIAKANKDQNDKRNNTMYRNETFYSPKIQVDKVSVQVIIDCSVAEIFIADGRYVISVVFNNSDIENNLGDERLEVIGDLELFELK